MYSAEVNLLSRQWKVIVLGDLFELEDMMNRALGVERRMKDSA